MGRLSSVVIVLLLAGCSLFGSSQTIVCDGVFPQWVLDAQDYDGGGCAEALPLDQAPENADWTPVCTGLCLCDRGEVRIDDGCTVIPPDRPWPSRIPYP